MNANVESDAFNTPGTTTEDFLNTVLIEIADCSDEMGKMKLTKEAQIYLRQQNPETGRVYNWYKMNLRNIARMKEGVG